MPELPEVETVIRNLRPLIDGHQITKVKVNYPKMILNSVEEFKDVLVNKEFKDIRRRGKYILFDLSSNLTLISHLRMEGKYSVLNEEDSLPKHAHVVFYLNNRTKLVYSDTRKFGRMHLVATNEVSKTKEIAKLGYEPFDPAFNSNIFYESLSKRKRSKIKPLLLTQEIVVGLGNIYVDETLFYAKIHPASIASHLDINDATLLREGIIEILNKAIEQGGTTIFSYKNALGKIGNYQNFLKVHKQEGKPCPRDGQPIEKIKLDGRSTYFCPKCQILK